MSLALGVTRRQAPSITSSNEPADLTVARLHNELYRAEQAGFNCGLRDRRKNGHVGLERSEEDLDVGVFGGLEDSPNGRGGQDQLGSLDRGEERDEIGSLDRGMNESEIDSLDRRGCRYQMGRLGRGRRGGQIRGCENDKQQLQGSMDSHEQAQHSTPQQLQGSMDSHEQAQHSPPQQLQGSMDSLEHSQQHSKQPGLLDECYDKAEDYVGLNVEDNCCVGGNDEGDGCVRVNDEDLLLNSVVEMLNEATEVSTSVLNASNVEQSNSLTSVSDNCIESTSVDDHLPYLTLLSSISVSSHPPTPPPPPQFWCSLCSEMYDSCEGAKDCFTRHPEMYSSSSSSWHSCEDRQSVRDSDARPFFCRQTLGDRQTQRVNDVCTHCSHLCATFFFAHLAQHKHTNNFTTPGPHTT